MGPTDRERRWPNCPRIGGRSADFRQNLPFGAHVVRVTTMSKEVTKLSVSPQDDPAGVGGENSEQRPPTKQGKIAGPGNRRFPWKKLLVGALLVSPFAIGGLWVAVHSIPWMGPFVANSLRATIGKERVTRLEEFVYSIEDRVNRTVKANDKPKIYWKVPEKAAQIPTPPVQQALQQDANGGNGEQESKLPPFAPPEPGPAHQRWSAEGDGVWVPLGDPRRPGEEPRMFKTLLHPDDSRSWAELFVVAVDLRTVSVMPMMGYQEPRSDKPAAQNYQRAAKIPEKHYGALLAAFNGGFMAEHGAYGVYFDNVLFIDPKDDACTLAQYKDGSFQVASWHRIKEKQSDMAWFRQAPNCMYEDGNMHPNLKSHFARKWGATLDGNTVIRRSAVGLSEDRKILFVGISNHTTAKVMAAGMHHAGAFTVAQMDVNWSYPKFVTFRQEKDLLHPVKLADGFEFSDTLYLREREMRDFFYLARKEEIEVSRPDLGSQAPPETQQQVQTQPNPPTNH